MQIWFAVASATFAFLEQLNDMCALCNPHSNLLKGQHIMGILDKWPKAHVKAGRYGQCKAFLECTLAPFTWAWPFMQPYPVSVTAAPAALQVLGLYTLS